MSRNSYLAMAACFAVLALALALVVRPWYLGLAFGGVAVGFAVRAARTPR
jgi:type IV secretory pathway TrbD component